MDKTERLLRMMEHPEHYSNEQLQELLSDEECRELYEAMRLSASAFEAEDAKEKIANGIKDEEWQKFESVELRTESLESLELRTESLEFPTGLQTGSKPSADSRADSRAVANSKLSTLNSKLPSTAVANSKLYTLNSKLLKLAAAFIGLLMLSGIAYAAIHIASHHQQSEASLAADTTAVANSQLSTPNSQLPSDSIAQPRLYDNVHLGEILDELSTYYNIKVVYYTEDARHPRLYYQWKPEYTIEKVVEMLNNFEWLQMELENDTLYVKSTAIPANDC